MKTLPIAEHKCRCIRDWGGVKFTRATLLFDRRLELAHQCEKHAEEQCVHVLDARTVDVIGEALATG